MEDLDLAENIETDNIKWPDSKEIILSPRDYELENCAFEDDADTESTVSVNDVEDISPQHLESKVGQLNISSCPVVNVGNQAYYHGDVTIQQYVLSSKDAQKALPSDLKGQVTFIGAVNKEENKNLKNIVSSVKRRHLLFIFIVILVLIGMAVTLILLLPTNEENEWDSEMNANSTLLLYSRKDWHAEPSRGKVEDLKVNPPHYVIIAHTAGSNCTSFTTCSQKVRDIQIDHLGRGWSDMGMHFLVGGDGAAYTGLGWGKFGSHTIPFNRRSIAIYFIGTFVSILPPQRQIRAAKLLIEEGVKLGKIAPDYKLFAHKQVLATESPRCSINGRFEKMASLDHL
uniref:Peptidoglycan recognition protein n=1 Tax=Rhodnius prolixus TaxID=13249 RepID=A0A905QWX5_RHOPR